MKFLTRKSLICLILICNYYILLAKSPNDAHRLYHYLMTENAYNKNVRPVLNFSHPTVVDVDLEVLNILSFDEVGQTLELTAKLSLYWTDEYLTWNKSMFGGIESLNIPQNDIWKPDITLENTIGRYVDLGASSMYVLLSSDGRIKWKPLEVFQSTCATDITHFPLDTQRCCLHFEAWSHAMGVVSLQTLHDCVALHGLLPDTSGHPEWSITATKADTIVDRGDLYATFCITLKRKSLYVMMNVIMPISMLSVLSMFVFTLPNECGEKASFAVTVFLSLAVFLTMVSQQFPKTSDNVSVFNAYVFVEVLLNTIITIVTLLQLRLHYRPDSSKVPLWLQRLVGKSCRAKNVIHVVCTKPVDNRSIGVTSNDKDVNIANDMPDKVTWRRVAAWLDPLLFWTFIFINGIFTFSLLIFTIVSVE